MSGAWVPIRSRHSLRSHSQRSPRLCVERPSRNLQRLAALDLRRHRYLRPPRRETARRPAQRRAPHCRALGYSCRKTMAATSPTTGTQNWNNIVRADPNTCTPRVPHREAVCAGRTRHSRSARTAPRRHGPGGPATPVAPAPGRRREGVREAQGDQNKRPQSVAVGGHLQRAKVLREQGLCQHRVPRPHHCGPEHHQRADDVGVGEYPSPCRRRRRRRCQRNPSATPTTTSLVSCSQRRAAAVMAAKIGAVLMSSALSEAEASWIASANTNLVGRHHHQREHREIRQVHAGQSSGPLDTQRITSSARLISA